MTLEPLLPKKHSTTLKLWLHSAALASEGSGMLFDSRSLGRIHTGRCGRCWRDRESKSPLFFLRSRIPHTFLPLQHHCAPLLRDQITTVRIFFLNLKSFTVSFQQSLRKFEAFDAFRVFSSALSLKCQVFLHNESLFFQIFNVSARSQESRVGWGFLSRPVSVCWTLDKESATLRVNPVKIHLGRDK